MVVNHPAIKHTLCKFYDVFCLSYLKGQMKQFMEEMSKSLWRCTIFPHTSTWTLTWNCCLKEGRLLEGRCLLFSYTDSVVDEAWKFINKIAMETGYSCISTVRKVRDDCGGHLFERGACLTLWPRGWELTRAWVLIWGNKRNQVMACLLIVI